MGTSHGVLVFTSATLATLKAEVMKYIVNCGLNTSEETGRGWIWADWVSTTDCLCAMLWLAIMRARCWRLGRNATARFTTAVDARRRLSNPLPNYFGNLIVAAVATMSINELVQPEV